MAIQYGKVKDKNGNLVNIKLEPGKILNRDTGAELDTSLFEEPDLDKMKDIAEDLKNPSIANLTSKKLEDKNYSKYVRDMPTYWAVLNEFLKFDNVPDALEIEERANKFVGYIADEMKKVDDKKGPNVEKLKDMIDAFVIDGPNFMIYPIAKKFKELGFDTMIELDGVRLVKIPV